jgi:3-hydroxyacyl-CoA dehydrogenase/3-hydroxy-2-methylbutyryl-CoA dehydrogenase
VVQLVGARAVVTGAASGLGADVARMLLEAGAAVAGLDLESAWDAAGDVPMGLRRFDVDVTDPDRVTAVVEAAAESMAGISVLVSCAGISPTARVVARSGDLFPLERYRSAIDVNLVGCFDVLRNVAAHMARVEPDDDGERGVIVNFGSIAAYDGQVGQAAYSASKGGIVAMTLPLARDLAPWGIRVMTVCPGTIDTPMVAAAPAAVRDSLSRANAFPARFGRPDEVSSVVRLCLENSYLNGDVIRVDAGARLPSR